MFRENVKNQTELGKLANEYMSKGELVPDEVTIKMLLERISRDDAKAGAMFDGFPRNVVQAKALDEALQANGARVDHALLIHERNDPPKAPGVCDACGGELYQREDDRPEVVRARLEKQKPPAGLIEHYRQAGVLKEIDGERSLDDVTASLLEAIR